MAIASLSDARTAVQATLSDPPAPAGRWTWAQVLVHCAQSIECSMKGFPKLKPKFIRSTVGRIVAGSFLRKGALSHDTTASIPGLEDPPDGIELDAAWERLSKAIEDFEGFEGELQPHFIFGDVPKTEYGQLHAMHIADHLGSVER